MRKSRINRIFRNVQKKSSETKFLVRSGLAQTSSQAYGHYPIEFSTNNGTTIYNNIGRSIKFKTLTLNAFFHLLESTGQTNWTSGMCLCRVLLLQYRTGTNALPYPSDPSRIFLHGPVGTTVVQDRLNTKVNPKVARVLREEIIPLKIQRSNGINDQSVPSMGCVRWTVPVHNTVMFNNFNLITNCKDTYGLVITYACATTETGMYVPEANLVCRWYACMSFNDL